MLHEALPSLVITYWCWKDMVGNNCVLSLSYSSAPSKGLSTYPLFPSALAGSKCLPSVYFAAFKGLLLLPKKYTAKCQPCMVL